MSGKFAFWSWPNLHKRLYPRKFIFRRGSLLWSILNGHSFVVRFYPRPDPSLLFGDVLKVGWNVDSSIHCAIYQVGKSAVVTVAENCYDIVCWLFDSRVIYKLCARNWQFWVMLRDLVGFSVPKFKLKEGYLMFLIHEPTNGKKRFFLTNFSKNKMCMM